MQIATPHSIISRLPLKHDFSSSLTPRENKVTWFTIDSRHCQDLDDAIYCERIWDNEYLFQAHIADLTEIMPPGSKMDHYAQWRVCTAYMEEYTSHMISRNIAEQIATLKPDQERHTITYECIITGQWYIVEEKIFPSWFESIGRLHYHNFWSLKNVHPDIYNSTQEVSQLLSKIVWGNFESDRWIVDFRNKASQLATWPRAIVQNAMVFTNTRVAKFLIENFDVGIFRNQLWVNQPAEYSNTPQMHASLKTSAYTHHSSPIRRYADNIVHRILLGVWNIQASEVIELCEYINRRIPEIRDEMKLKWLKDKKTKTQRRLNKVKKWDNNINFKYMKDREFKFHLIYFARWEYHENQELRTNFLEALKLRFENPLNTIWKEYLIYLFLVWDQEFKQVSYETLLSQKMNDTVIGKHIAHLFYINEEISDDEMWTHVKWELRFVWKTQVLISQNFTLPLTHRPWTKSKKKFIVNSVLNWGIHLPIKHGLKYLQQPQI